MRSLGVTVLVLGSALSGCSSAHSIARDGDLPDAGARVDAAEPDGRVPGRDAALPPPPPTQDVDLLFVIDNSNSMIDEQIAFAAEIPRLVNILATGDFDQDGSSTGPDDFTPVEELHVGVVTTDMGTGGYVVPTCPSSDFGDDGVLRTTGDSSGPGCMAVYPSFLAFRTGESASAFANQAACVSRTGIEGCGFEQPLEAALKALSPAVPTEWTAAGYDAPRFFRNTFGHGDLENAGLLRRDSILGIVLLSDEEDCSVSDTAIFDLVGGTYADTPPNLRCSEHEAAALHAVSRYVDGFVQLRRHPSRVVFAPIVGVPVDLVPGPGERPDWSGILADPRMRYRIDPSSGGTSLVPSCDRAEGRAYPPRRMVRLARELEARGAATSLGSICQSAYSGVLTEIIRQLAR